MILSQVHRLAAVAEEAGSGRRERSDPWGEAERKLP